MIDGLSAATMRQIQAHELAKPRFDSVSECLRRWRSLTTMTRRQLEDGIEFGDRCGILECCPTMLDIRSSIEDCLRALTPKARGELAALVQPLDEKLDEYLRANLGTRIQLDTWLTLRAPR